ncbi:hypothetical protein [Frigidibacter sp. ROC022]|uniref:hypothetical protein n=1 Tax=Frigidibacter sp. ROC022 TaxID=2971796 RepID=UPI00215A56F9|nr:hypothetical protein [Frigidibacter sp. ROC022]MCR8726413.1 hypothetical protein [Frigidibacter sp. ROC022]
MTALKILWHRHRLLSLAFLAALTLTCVFAVRGLLLMPLFGAPPPDPPIEGWMTPRLVAHGWHLPPEVLGAALGIEPGSAKGRTLEQIARDQGRTVEELAASIEEAALMHRALKGMPPLPPPPSPDFVPAPPPEPAPAPPAPEKTDP